MPSAEECAELEARTLRSRAALSAETSVDPVITQRIDPATGSSMEPLMVQMRERWPELREAVPRSAPQSTSTPPPTAASPFFEQAWVRKYVGRPLFSTRTTQKRGATSARRTPSKGDTVSTELKGIRFEDETAGIVRGDEEGRGIPVKAATSVQSHVANGHKRRQRFFRQVGNTDIESCDSTRSASVSTDQDDSALFDYLLGLAHPSGDASAAGPPNSFLAALDSLEAKVPKLRHRYEMEMNFMRGQLAERDIMIDQLKAKLRRRERSSK
ncbi:hypothetical protein BCV70DRAFT_197740 [Testicularia cyperi]|uniref:Uncharacterized protein n=1 Tax=Testicularia cyperi TaxID=1882483 RepID=A0A317Y012_9BASI|nr:hypothetical protein BCV70DRAFT_197740 [Testicularia cyperi]